MVKLIDVHPSGEAYNIAEGILKVKSSGATTCEVDMLGTIRALKEIHDKGQIYPEHFPAIAGDHAAGPAWTIGYIRALDRAV